MVVNTTMLWTLRRVWQFLAELIVSSFILHSLFVIFGAVIGGILDESLTEGGGTSLTLGLCRMVLVFPLWASLSVILLGSLRGLFAACTWLLLSEVGTSLLTWVGSHNSSVGFENLALELGLSILGVAVGIFIGFLTLKRLARALGRKGSVPLLRPSYVVPVAFVLGLGYVLFWEVDVASVMTEMFGLATLADEEQMKGLFLEATSTQRVLRNVMIETFMALTGRLGRTVFCGDPAVVLGGLSYLAYCLAFRTVLVNRHPKKRFWSLPVVGILAFAVWAFAAGNPRVGTLFSPCGDFKLKDRAAVSACMVAVWRQHDPTLLAVFARSSTWRLFYLVLLTLGALILLVTGQIFRAPQPAKMRPDSTQRRNPRIQPR